MPAYTSFIDACAHFQRAQSPTAPSRDERKRLFRYGLYYNFNDVGTLALSSRVDNFFIAAFMDPIAVGTFSFYTRLSGMVTRSLPTNMFQNVIRPVFFATAPAEAAVRIPKYFTLLINTSLLFTVPITAYAAVYHRELVDVVFGGKFREHSLLLPVVLLFVTTNIISVPVALAAQYAEKAHVILLSKVFGVFNLLAMLALIPILGVYGAALATGMCDAAEEPLHLVVGPAYRPLDELLGSHGRDGALLERVLRSMQHAEKPIDDVADRSLAARRSDLPRRDRRLRSHAGDVFFRSRRFLGSVLKGKERRWLKLAGLVS